MRVVSNPYGEVFLHDIGDGNSLLYVESADRHGRRVSVSIPLTAAEVGALGRFAYLELALPAEREQARATVDVEPDAEPRALPAAPRKREVASKPGRRKRRGNQSGKRMPPRGSIDYEAVARAYMSDEAAASGSRRGYVCETLGLIPTTATNRIATARKLGLIPEGWYADGYGPTGSVPPQAPEAAEAGLDKLRGLVNGQAPAPVDEALA